MSFYILGMFSCHQSHCIPLFMVCDNIPDCHMGQDEVFCTLGSKVLNTEEPRKIEGLLRCRYDNIYIPSVYVCDGVVHCLQSQVVFVVDNIFTINKCVQ